MINLTKIFFCFWLWFFIFWGSIPACGQVITPPNIEKITAAEFDEWLSNYNNLSKISIMDIMETRRLDLVQSLMRECFNDNIKRADLLRAINVVSDAEFKDSVTVMALRNDPRENQSVLGRMWKDYGEVSPLLQYNTPYRSIILKYFPGLPLRDVLIASPAAKNILADGIEEVRQHPERMEVIRNRLAAMPVAPGTRNGVQPIRAPTELRQVLRNLELQSEENAKLEGTPSFNLDLSERNAALRRYCLEELKASEWIEAHGKSVGHHFDGLRPVSVVDSATLPVQAPPKAHKDNAAWSLAEWRFWGVLGGVGLGFFVLIRLVQRRIAFQGHGI